MIIEALWLVLWRCLGWRLLPGTHHQKKSLLSIIPLRLNLQYYLPVCQNRSLANSAIFYVSFSVHLGIILVNNQLDALLSVFLLFHFSTCFEYWCSEHVERWNNKYTEKSASSWLLTIIIPSYSCFITTFLRNMTLCTLCSVYSVDK
jgi:hypothetical protein